MLSTQMAGPDLEEEKNNLVVQNAKNNKMLKDIEVQKAISFGQWGGPTDSLGHDFKVLLYASR